MLIGHIFFSGLNHQGDHKIGLIEGFTKKYKVHKLVYFERFDYISSAIKREKHFKSGYGRRFLRNRLESFLKEFN